VQSCVDNWWILSNGYGDDELGYAVAVAVAVVVVPLRASLVGRIAGAQHPAGVVDIRVDIHCEVAAAVVDFVVERGTWRVGEMMVVLPVTVKAVPWFLSLSCMTKGGI
jgi:hypothetical protein